MPEQTRTSDPRGARPEPTGARTTNRARHDAADGALSGELSCRLTIAGLAWLATDVILAVVLGADAREAPEVAVSLGDDVVESDAGWLGHGGGEGETGEAGILIVHVPGARRGQTLRLTLRAGGQEATLGPADAWSLGIDLRTFIREHLASLGAEIRARCMDFLLEQAGGLESADAVGLSRSLATLRGGLRELSPRSLVMREQPQGLHIEAIVGLDERSFFVRGWMRDERAEIVRLTAISPEGARASLLGRVFRTRRADVDELYGTPPERSERPGFLAHFTLEAPSRLERGWVFEIENATGVTTEAEGPEVTLDPIAGRATIVAELAHERGPDTDLMEHVVPAVSRLQERLADGISIERVEQFGSPPRAPVVSIVVPLYQRCDLLHHQLAAFAGDADVGRADLIYVLDSPELSAQLFEVAADLHEIYRVPFRIAEASRNGGFSVANNLGASVAEGHLLLLLNSDVLPAAAGWLPPLVEFHDSSPEIGAVGPKLLFDDETLQHAGLYWRRSAPYAPWENAHYFKGIHKSLPDANVARPVPAVTAACLLTSLDLYRELGGLSNVYIQGDYEDSDFCLRLRQAGYEPWYLPQVELYHLEGRSYDTAVRQAHARYNSWLHTRLWGDQIEALMADHKNPSPGFLAEQDS
jgi:GT2 family glycosyltransferase